MPLVRRVQPLLLTALFAAATLLLSPQRTNADFPPYAKVVGIAVVAPLSGPEKNLGLDLSAGVKAAIDDYNAQRGLTDYVYSYASFDDQGDPGIAQQQAQFALVDPNVAFVIGHLGGQETLLAENVYHEQGVPLIIPMSSIARLTQMGYDNVFRLCTSDTAEGQLDARYAERTLKAKKTAVLWLQDDFGADTATGFMNYVSAANQMKAQDFPIDLDMKTLGATITKAMAYAPDLVYVSGRSDDLVKVLRALHAAGNSAPILASSGLYDDAAMKSLKDLAQGVEVSTCVPPIQLMPSVAVFQRRYESQHGRLTALSLFGYAAAQVAISAAQDAGTTDKRILIRKLSTGLFQTIIGPVSFRTGGDPSEPDVYFYRYDTTNGFRYEAAAFPNPLILR